MIQKLIIQEKYLCCNALLGLSEACELGNRGSLRRSIGWHGYRAELPPKESSEISIALPVWEIRRRLGTLLTL